MKSGPNPKMFIILAASTLVIGGAAVFLGYGGMSDEAAKVARLKSEVKPGKQVQQELDDSKAKLADFSSKLKHLEAGISDAAYVPTLLSELEKVGKANGIEVLGVRPVPAQAVAKDAKRERKAYDEQTIEVKGRGSYAAVLKFVKALQDFPKIVAARTISLAPKIDAGKVAGDSTLDMTLELKAYVFPTESTTGPTKETSLSAGLEVKRNEG